MISTATDKIEAISNYPHLPFPANLGQTHIRSVPSAIPQLQPATAPIPESAKIFLQQQSVPFNYNGHITQTKPIAAQVAVPNMLPKPAETMISPMDSSCSSVSGSDKQLCSPCSNTFGSSTSIDEDKKVKDKCSYLKALLQDKKQLQSFPPMFVHVERILDEEIVKVRSVLFQNGDSSPLELPPAQGPTVVLTEKVYVPVKDHPEYNFVGRILGPRGLTAKQLEQEAKCKIMVRGKGSMRDKKKEEMNRGKPNWEHLNDDLHVLITVEDTENRARVKIKRAVDEVNKLLVPAEGEDDLKKKQLMELAIINGTYRDFTAQPRLQPTQHVPVVSIPGMRSPAPGQPNTSVLSTPIITRLPNGQTVIANGGGPPHPPIIAPTEGAFYYTTPIEYPYAAAGLVTAQGQALLEYSFPDPTILGATPGAKIVRQRSDTRVHPYQRSPAATN